MRLICFPASSIAPACATAMAALACVSHIAVAHGSDNEAPAADRATMVVMAPVGPVLADVRISISGQPYRKWVTGFLAKNLDANGDGSLTEAEIDMIPQRLRDQTGVTSAAEILLQASGNKEAIVVSQQAFTIWFSEQLSRSFDVIAEAISASEAVRLAGLIDQNDDGRIGREELAQGTHTLRFRDLDDDETFSVSELMPFRDPRNQQAAVVPEVADLPFLQITDDDAVARTAARLANRYGDGQHVPLDMLRLPQASLSAFDGDADGMLSEDELHRFMAEPTFHLTIEILLSDQSSSSRINILPIGDAAKFCRVAQTRRDRASVVIDDMPVEIRSRGGGAQNRTFLIRFLGQHFSIADADKSGYVDSSEFSGLSGPLGQAGVATDFASADLNDDEMVTREELRDFVERDTIATQSHIEVSVRQDGKTLFKLLDGNTDRRLTPREFREGFAALMEHDLNRDGQLAESELGTRYVLQIGLGQPESLRMGASSMNMMRNSTDAILPGTSRLAGPEWFRRMDRNQDGDVSFREFPGTNSMFQQLDTDADGFVSADEAEQVGIK